MMFSCFAVVDTCCLCGCRCPRR